MFVLTCVILFILRLRFRNKPLSNLILEQYNGDVVKIFRDYEKYDLKLRKTKCDIEFLSKCITNNLSPKFLNFKLSLPIYRNDQDYKKYQRRLLHKELNSKQILLKEYRILREDNYSTLRNTTSYLYFNHIISQVSEWNEKKETKVKETHRRKLFNLGLKHQYDAIPHQNIIFNLSDRLLTDEETETLALGLNFRFSPTKLNYHDFFSAYEELFRSLCSNQIFNAIPDAANYVRTAIKSIALKLIIPSNLFYPIYHENVYLFSRV